MRRNIIISLALLLMASCQEFQPVFTGKYDEPAHYEKAELEPTHTIAALADMYVNGKPWTIDEEIIIKAAQETGAIVTAEEHSVIGGLGSAVAEVVVKNCPVKMAMVGQQDTFGESGKPDELKAKYGMTAADIVKAVKSVK